MAVTDDDVRDLIVALDQGSAIRAVLRLERYSVARREMLVVD